MFHLLVIIFSCIPISLIKILREERQDHLNYWQNSSPFSPCCCISLIGRKLDNFQWQIQGRGPGGLPPSPIVAVLGLRRSEPESLFFPPRQENTVETGCLRTGRGPFLGYDARDNPIAAPRGTCTEVATVVQKTAIYQVVGLLAEDEHDVNLAYFETGHQVEFVTPPSVLNGLRRSQILLSPVDVALYARRQLARAKAHPGDEFIHVEVVAEEVERTFLGLDSRGGLGRFPPRGWRQRGRIGRKRRTPLLFQGLALGNGACQGYPSVLAPAGMPAATWQTLAR